MTTTANKKDELVALCEKFITASNDPEKEPWELVQIIDEITMCGLLAKMDDVEIMLRSLEYLVADLERAHQAVFTIKKYLLNEMPKKEALSLISGCLREAAENITLMADDLDDAQA